MLLKTPGVATRRGYYCGNQPEDSDRLTQHGRFAAVGTQQEAGIHRSKKKIEKEGCRSKKVIAYIIPKEAVMRPQTPQAFHQEMYGGQQYGIQQGTIDKGEPVIVPQQYRPQTAGKKKIHHSSQQEEQKRAPGC
jgi:hypothetical protein